MYPENPKGTQVIAGSMNMGYVAVVLNFTIASHMLIVESFRGLVWRCYAGRRDPPPVSEPVSTPQPGLTLCFLFPIDRWKLRPFQHPKNWPPFSGRSRGGGLGAPPPLRSRRLAPPFQSRRALHPLRPRRQPRITKTKHAFRNRIHSSFQIKVSNNINIMIHRGYVTASAAAKTLRLRGREADQALGCCRIWAATDPVDRMIQTTSGFV